jgi:catechol 2,3-dioxygenase-like lactoylglutathione lyase family enzyme
MPASDIHPLPIDHVELFVPDRYEAAAWYARVLKLEIIAGYEQWAADARGPLMISGDGGTTKLALFEGKPDTSSPNAGFRRVAFRVSAGGLSDWLRRLAALEVRDERGRPLTVESVVDHDQAYSIYFPDPYGHRWEITTYDYDAMRRQLVEMRNQPG